MKILFTASIAKHILRFHIPYLKWFHEQGVEVHVACQGEEDIPYCDRKWLVPFIRTPYSLGHFAAYRLLKKIIDKENYTLIHCHTPMASNITRLAAIKTRKQGTRVLYTAHGFHFYNKGSFFNWIFYYPIELIYTYLSDVIITINKEDYDIIRKKGSKSAKYFLIPGVGVSSEKFFPVSKEKKLEIRNSNGFTEDDFILVYAGEFIPRKNHKFLIKATEILLKEIPSIKVLLAGRGVLDKQLKNLANSRSLDLNSIKFLGFRSDINEIYQMADIGVSTSRQEGLGLNLIEEMMCELPVVATMDRGHKEIVLDGVNGYLFSQGSTEEFVSLVTKLYNDRKHIEFLAKNASKSILKFELHNALSVMKKIYLSQK